MTLLMELESGIVFIKSSFSYQKNAASAKYFQFPYYRSKIQFDVELMWRKQGNSCLGKGCDVVLM